ncbi:ATP-binding cassette domain-containing protein [Halobacteriovorax sp. DPLXC-1]|uniref:ATP-binding cassette domain-containing protein n=1 Tax=Halobacteriovorax sp. DPLXC-1 TaxID=3110771 RepID=UPI002FF0E8FC
MTNLKLIFHHFMELKYEDEYKEEVNEILMSFVNMKEVDLINSLATLGLQGRPFKIKLKNIERDTLPCIVISNTDVKDFCNKGDYLIYSYDSDEEKSYLINDQEQKRHINEKKFKIKYALLIKEFTSVDYDNEKIFTNTSVNFSTWIKTIMSRFDKHLRRIYFLSFLNVFTTLALPLFVMFIYDKIVGSKDLQTLIPATTGILLLLALDFSARNIRSNIISWCACRVDYFFEVAILQKMSNMSDHQREVEKLDYQINRFEDIRNSINFFSSPSTLMLIDTVFNAILIIPIFFLSWQMAIPLLLLVPIYTILYRQHIGKLRLKKQYFSEINTEKNNLTNELKRRSEDIYLESLFPVFNKRLSSLTSRSCYSGHQNQMLVHQLELIAYVMTIAVGIASVATGVLLVWDQSLAMGNFMAVMLILWRILSPAQQLLNSRQRLDTIKFTFQNLHRFFRAQTENRTYQTYEDLNANNFDVQFKGVCFRYPESLENVFVGVDIKLKEGEIYGVHAGAESGKSAFIKLLNKTYLPQSGSIQIGGVDHRQFDTLFLRHKILTLNLTNSLTKDLSIYENIKYINPLIKRDDILIKLGLFGIGDMLEKEGITIDTPLSGSTKLKISNELYAAIVLAIPFCTEAKLVLIEEIPTSLINEQLNLLHKFLKLSKGNFGVVFCCEHKEMLKEADKIIYMAPGSQVFSGSKDKLIPALEERALI